LNEANEWASKHTGETKKAFSHASISSYAPETDVTLSSSRAYALALAPHLIYAKSNVVTALVSSQLHNQLDFQAVGSWFILDVPKQDSQSESALTRVPSSREDVFQDSTLDLKAKRSLMKFLRFVTAYEDQPETWQESRDEPFSSFLQQKFGLPPASHAPIVALTMSRKDSKSTLTRDALPQITQHLRSIGVFGPGFGAVLPKWGGLAEVAQVACRACAVGGGVYVLNKPLRESTYIEGSEKLQLNIGDGESITTSWFCTSVEAPRAFGRPKKPDPKLGYISKSMSIVSSPIDALFPATSEGGVTPAGAVVVVHPVSEDETPVHLIVHTSEAGECPMNQCKYPRRTPLPFL
jgi:Rab proteins geranylgeranyltransferase component A